MDMQHLDTILIVMVAVYGVSVLLHISVLAFLALGMNKVLKQAKQYADDLDAKIKPVLSLAQEVLHETKTLVTTLEPKLDAAAADMSEVARIARDGAARISASAGEITDRVRRQAERVDQMTSDALDGVEKAGHFLSNAVGTPVRRASAFVAAARAILSVLRQPARPRSAPPRDSQPTDEDIQRERQQYV